jgi:hypothetical protein
MDRDPDCECGHPASEHGQTFGGRCYNEREYEGNTFLCSCDELRIDRTP